MVRGAFEYQGQKCSAASRAYVPRVAVAADQGRPRRRSPTSLTHGRRHRPVQLHGRGHRRPGVRQAQGRHRPGARDRRRRRRRRRHVRRQRGLLRPPDGRCEIDDPTDEIVHAPSTSARSCRSTSTPTAQYDKVLDQMESFAPYALTGSIIAQDRRRHRRRHAAAAVRRRQLLRQRQADRCGRRPAAVRRRPRVGHQRQGRRRAEPAALDQRRARSRRRSSRRPTTPTRTWADPPAQPKGSEPLWFQPFRMPRGRHQSSAVTARLSGRATPARSGARCRWPPRSAGPRPSRSCRR